MINWSNWQEWRVSVNYLEEITGYDFLSNVPDEIEEIIENDNSSSPQASLYAIPGSIPLSDSSVSPRIGTGDNTSTGHDGFVSIPTEGTAISDSTLEVGSNQLGFFDEAVSKISSSEIRIVEGSKPKNRIFQVSIPENSSIQTRPAKFSVSQDSVFKDNIFQSDFHQVNSAQINPREISFASSISSEQFFSIHNLTPEIINRLNNSATNIWSDLLQSPTQLNIDFQITDLPTGQLAEATITGFDNSGVPNAGTILIDHDANGIGWFIDPTPLDNSEFTAQNTDSYLLAAIESEADGKYDLLTTVLHELAHLYGFIDGYAGFDANIKTEDGTTKFIGNDFEAVLDGEYLNKEAHPYDLMNTHLSPGVRKLPSELNVQILQAILNEKSEVRSQKSEGNLEAALSSDPLLAIANGDFSISDTTTDSFAWDTRGASGIEDSQAVLTEDSPFLSNFTQTFTVPEAAKTLQFTLVDTELGASELAPPDAFEVALLDANTQESLATEIGLTETDSLLNIQNDGTAYFSDKVRIGGASSGEIIDLDKSRTITVDISNLTPGTEAILYFDLLGFGEADSRIVIDDVRLSDQNLLPPVAADDTATTAQGQPVIIDILSNDSDDDGTIAVDSVQIQTEPENGSALLRPDGTVSYIPGTGFAGTDSFTYVVQDNDGQLSNPATVSITVDNAAPTITELQIPDGITEGTEVELGAIASDIKFGGQRVIE